MNKFLEEPSLSIQGNRHIALHIFVSYTVKTKVLLTFDLVLLLVRREVSFLVFQTLLLKGQSNEIFDLQFNSPFDLIH